MEFLLLENVLLGLIFHLFSLQIAIFLLYFHEICLNETLRFDYRNLIRRAFGTQFLPCFQFVVVRINILQIFHLVSSLTANHTFQFTPKSFLLSLKLSLPLLKHLVESVAKTFLSLSIALWEILSISLFDPILVIFLNFFHLLNICAVGLVVKYLVKLQVVQQL